MKENRKRRSDRRDYRLAVLYILGLAILAWQGLFVLEDYFRSSSPASKEETVVFRCAKDALTMLPRRNVMDGRPDSTGKISGLPQFSRPVFFLPVNLNMADRNLLQTIPGVGPSLSSSIVDFRQREGEISSYNELLKINGIGPYTLEKIQQYSTL